MECNLFYLLLPLYDNTSSVTPQNGVNVGQVRAEFQKCPNIIK